ncbi:Hypothetical protein A7982_06174 [Minicystis rosea]|nr:Hypothetical protein A7982_06174 [Minicystis rosea]
MDANHVRGTYDAVVEGTTDPGPENTRHLTGSFDVCRLPRHHETF